MYEQPAGRRGHDAAKPQRHARASARYRPVPAFARARHQQQPADAHARLRGPVTAYHTGRQEQPDRRRGVPEAIRLDPAQGAQHQRQPAVTLPQAATVGHRARVPVHGQQQLSRDTQRRQQTHQVRCSPVL